MANKYFIDCGAHLLQGFNQFLDHKLIDGEFHCFSIEANPYIFARCLSEALPESRKKVASLHLLNCAVSGKSLDKDFERLITLNSCRVESHIHQDPKSATFLRKFRNFIRKLRQAVAERIYGRANIGKKKQLENTVATMASNILKKPPSSDSGYSFSYETERVASIRLIEILKYLENPIEVVVKVDIEGAEFFALQDLIDNIHQIPFEGSILKIYVEWHERFYDDFQKYSAWRRNIEEGLTNANILVYDWV
jgi:hypothetical protein